VGNLYGEGLCTKKEEQLCLISSENCRRRLGGGPMGTRRQCGPGGVGITDQFTIILQIRGGLFIYKEIFSPGFKEVVGSTECMLEL